MADYRIRVGTELDTKGIDTGINKYDKKKSIELKSKLDMSGIDKKLASYKKPVKIDAKLNTSGIAKQISGYKPKTPIKLNAKLNPQSINETIKSYNGKKSIELKVKLNNSNINDQIKNYKTKSSITIGTKIDKSNIAKQISEYTPKPIKLVAKLNKSNIDEVIKNYKAKPIKLSAKLNKGEINEQIKGFSPKNTIYLKASLKKGAIAKEIRDYEPSTPIKVDLKLGSTDIDAEVKKYEKKPVNVQAKLLPASSGFSAQLTKVPIKIPAELSPEAISNFVDDYTKNPVTIPVKLKPIEDGANGAISTEPIPVNAKLDPEDIKTIRQQIKSAKPQTPITVKAILDDSAIDAAIAEHQAKSPTIRVNVIANDADVDKKTGKQNVQTPIQVNVKLNRESINEEIKSFNTRTKLKVGIKLKPEGLKEQIDKIEPKTKVKVGAELDKDSINTDILNFKADTPIKLGVELDMENAKAEIEKLRADFQKFGKIVIQFPNANTGSGKQTSGSGSGGNIPSNTGQQFREIDVAVKATTNQVENLKKVLGDVGFSGGSIDVITKDFKNLGISVRNVTSRLNEDNTVTLTVKGIDQFERAVTVMKEVDSSGKNITNLGTTISQDFKETENAFKKLKSLGKEIGKLDIKIAGLDANKNKQEIDTLINQLNKLKKEYNDLFGITEKNLSSSQIERLEQDIANTSNKVSSIKSKILDAKNNLKNNLSEEIKFKIDTKDFEKDISNIESKTRNFGNVSKELKNNITQLKSNKTQMTNALASGDIDKAIKAYERYLKILETIENQLKISGNNQKVIDVDFGKLEKLKTEIDSIKKKIEGLDPKVNTEQLDILSTSLKELEADYNDLYKKLNGNLSTSQMDKLAMSSDRAERELAELKAKIADAKTALAKKIEIKLNDHTFANQIDNIKTKIDRLKEQPPEIEAAMNDVTSAIERMEAALKDGDVESAIKYYQDYERALKSVKNQLDINTRAEKADAEDKKLEDDRIAFQSKIDAWLTKNSAAAKQFGSRLQDLRRQAENCDRTTLDHLERELKQVDKEAEAAGKKMQTFGDRLKTQFSKYSSYLSVASLIMYATQAMRNMFEQVKLIDSAMTELKKVTNETDASYNEFLTNAASKAKELGTTVDGLISSTGDFARLGYGFKDSQKLAEVANIYAVVGDEIEGVEDATQSLVSTLAAFKSEMNGMSDSDFAMSIVDKMNEVSNNFAISSGGIGEALQRSASSMAAANNTLDETIAMITAANTVAQNPDKVGNAFKTMSMRIRGAKTELEEAGESTEGMAESTASLRQEIMALSGVDIMLDNNTFKSTYQIMDELSKKWKDLSDISQATIIELVAGKHQGNVFSSLMSNFDIARDALETSLNSSGSAMSEHAKWQKSLEAQLNKLKAAWQGLSQAFLKSDFLKKTIGLVTGFVDVLTKLVDTFGALPTVIGLGALGKGLFNHFTKDKKSITDVANAVEHLTDVIRDGAKATDEATAANERNTASEETEAAATAKSAAAETAETKANVAGTTSDLADKKGSDAAAEGEQNETKKTTGTIVAQDAEKKSDMDGLVSDLADKKGSDAAAEGEQNETIKTTATTVAQTAETTSDLADATVDAAKGTGVLGGAFSKLGGKIKGLGAGLKGLVGKLGSLVAAHPAIAAVVAIIAALSIRTAIENKRAKELAETVEEVTTKYKEQHNALTKVKKDYDTSNEDSLISKYGELSKGVDTFGKNVSLTADEYSEYQNIVNTIAEQIPNLVSGYNDQGDAILGCAGSVKKLREEYHNLIKEQNNEVLKSGADIFKDFKNDLEKSSAYHQEEVLKDNGDVSEYVKHYDLDHLEELKNLMNPENGDLQDALDKLSYEEVKRISDVLGEYGLKRNVLFDGEKGHENYKEHIIRAIEEEKKEVKSVLDEASKDLNAYAEDLGSVTEAYFSTAFLGGDDNITDYSHMSDRMQNIINKVASGFDTDFYAQFLDEEKYKTDEEKYDALTSYLNNMLDKFNRLSPENLTKFETAFDLKTQFNGGDISYGEYVKGLQEASGMIDGLGLDEEIENQLKLSLNTDEVTKEYDALRNRLADHTNYDFDPYINATAAEEFLNSLSSDELSVAVDVITKLSNNGAKETIQDIQDAINREMAIRGLILDLNLEVETAGIEALNTALAESKSATGLTAKSIDDLKSRYEDLDTFNAAKLFEETANGIRLNSTEAARLENEYKKLNKQDLDETLSKLTEEYNELTTEIDNCSDASERADLYAQRDSILDQINDTATLAAQYEGLTSAYNEWQSAQEAGQDRDQYESIISGRKDIEDEMSRGWLDDAAVEYLELLSGKELSTSPIEDQIAAYKELDKTIEGSKYSVWDFFTEDDDGNSTSDGVFNFFDTVKSVAGETHAWIDENGSYHFNFEGFEHDGKTGDAAIASILGISEELVQILLKTAEDAGFVVNIEGEYTDLANLKTEAEQANDRMKELSATTYTFDFDSTDIDNLNEQIGEAQLMLGNLKNEDGTLKVGVSEEDYRKAQDMIAALIYQKQLLDKSAILHVDTSNATEGIELTIKKIQELKGNLNTFELETAIGADTSEVETDIKSALDYINGLNPEVKAGLGLDTEEVQTAINGIQANISAGVEINQEHLATVNTAISNISNDAMISLGLDKTLIDEYMAAEHETNGTVIWDNNIEAVTTWINQAHEASGTVKWDDNTENLTTTFFGKGYITWNPAGADGTAGANGSAFAKGTVSESGRAFSQGNWGTKRDGNALGGELGTEILVRDGRWYTIGENGAEFFQYKKGDIIFNHRQTEELFANGKVTSGNGRGKTFADGNAFVGGLAFNGSGAIGGTSGSIKDAVKEGTKEGIKEAEKSSSSGSKGGNPTRDTVKDAVNSKKDSDKSNKPSNKNSSKDTKDEFEETFDWVEVAISRMERAIDRLDKKASATWRSWSTRNTNLRDEISLINDEIQLQEQAYTRYIEEANSVGLSSEWKKKVQNGEVDIETIEDEDLAEKIKSYQEWYEKALACKDAVLDLQDTEADKYNELFDNVVSKYDGILQGYEHTESMLNEYISQAEERGHIVSKEYYKELISNEKSNISQLKKEQSALIAARDEAVASGAIKKYSEDWYNMCSEIDGVTEAIEEGTTALLEYDNAMREIDWSIFDLVQERISNVTSEADFLIELMSNDKLYDENGKLTGQGAATMALHGQNYNTHMYQADEYGAEVARLNKQIAKDPYDQELINRRNELIELQRESILAAEDEKQAIRDLVEEGIELELDALQERIDKYNEAMDSAKDLYDYQKNVLEQTKEIASLEKQMAAYSGDDSEESKAKLQELKVSLEEAKTELQETEYDKYISDQEALLDNLYTEYELILNQRLDNVDDLLSQVVDGINAAMGADGTVTSALGADGAIATAITNAVSENGSIKSILNTEATSVGTTLSNAMNNIWSVGEGNAKSVLTTYGNNFQNNQTTTNTVLGNIKADVAKMVADLNKDAVQDTNESKTNPSSKEDPVKTNNSNAGKGGNGKDNKDDNKNDNKDDNKANFFIYKKSSYPKNKLDINKSIVDRLKYHDYDSSFSAREKYYKAMGYGDKYSGTSKQNLNMIAWMKKNGYAKGAYNLPKNELAWTQENGQEFIVRPSDGAILTPIAKGDSVLTSAASNNIWNMANSPAEFIKNNLKLDASSVPNNANVHSNCTQNFDKVVFNLPNVKNYNELLTEMQRDPKFEKLILSMTIDQIAGKSSLAKNKAIR